MGTERGAGRTTVGDARPEGPKVPVETADAGTPESRRRASRLPGGRRPERAGLHGVLAPRAARVGTAVVLALIIGVLAVHLVNQSSFGPHKPVEAYLDALVAGDAETAGTLIGTGAGPAGLLSDAVYGAAENRVSGYEVRDIAVEGDSATVVADLTQDGAATPREFTLTRTGSTALIFDEWRLDGPAPVGDVGVVVPQGFATLTVNGADVALPAGDADLYAGLRSLTLPALPGTYVVSPPPPSTYLSYGDEQSIVVPADPESAPPGVLIEAAPTPAVEDDAVAQVTEALAACIASTDDAPSGCPNRSYLFGDPEDVRGPRWTLDRDPTFTLEPSYEPGVYRLLSDDAEATFSYERNAEFEDSSPPRWEREEDTQTLFISATVTVTAEAIEVDLD
ncbi:hypothetical protein IWX63_001819 [Arthrobacter sp. CAN_A2]|uniref:nuclear transport factor 2 family protein n=1 Tax=Arthrobacter sp. CAN_A2 TaxID=2787718 RepID=UPI0018F00482